MIPSPLSRFPFLLRGNWLFSFAALLWVVAIIAITGKAASNPARRSTVEVYQGAGEKWMAGDKLYRKKFGGFVYGPVTAALLVPFSGLPKGGATLVWALLNAGILTGAMAWWLRSGLHRGITRRLDGWVFLLLFPLAVGNLNIAQVNPALIGLLMLGILACFHRQWMLGAFSIALAAHLKIYPLAVGLLLLVIYPKQFGWRLLFALVFLGGLSFLLQKPDYVLRQYQLWIETRLGENRLLLEGDRTCRDLWLVLRFFGIPVSQSVYHFLQGVSGMAIAGMLLWGRVKHWTEERLLVGLFSLVSVWMVLLGPATESPTYVILAPAVVLALVQAFSREEFSTLMRAWVVVAALLLVAQLGLNAFFRFERTLGYMSIQPIGAIVFCGYSLAALRNRYWREAIGEDRGLQREEGSFRVAQTI